jgi:hypothetical protein
MDWKLDLLTTYTHNSELHVITALSLISTLYIKSLAHAKSSQSSLVVSWQRISNSHTVTTAYVKSFFTAAIFIKNVPKIQKFMGGDSQTDRIETA